jgi:hypothetical protein
MEIAMKLNTVVLICSIVLLLEVAALNFFRHVSFSDQWMSILCGNFMLIYAVICLSQKKKK